MGVLRFPNAVSDIGKFIHTYKVLFQNLKDKPNFTHDDAVDVFVKYGLASSSGAIGLAAKARSLNEKRSLDPLYNQHKMYSEVYRMLGWYKPGTQRTNFNFTELSDYINEAGESDTKSIFQECLLGMTFPNFLVSNRGGNVSRPFSFLLQMMKRLGGVMHRDEMILSVLRVENDRVTSTLEHEADYIFSIRGEIDTLKKELETLANKNKTQVNTLQNYTRFVLGALIYSGWAEPTNVRTLYNVSTRVYKLTVLGEEFANRIAQSIDIRNSDIKNFSLEERGAFTLLTLYNFLERAGFEIDSVLDTVNTLIESNKVMLGQLGIEERHEILYSPIQQSSADEIQEANRLDEELAE